MLWIRFDEAGHLLGEYRADGTRNAEYVWMDDTLVAVLKSHGGTTYQYVLTDHLGSPRAVVKPNTNTVVFRSSDHESGKINVISPHGSVSTSGLAIEYE